jgi:hypothetical protein
MTGGENAPVRRGMARRIASFSPEGTRRGHGTLGADLVNATEHARRVVACGYAPSMSPQRIRQLSRTDPNFPTPWPTAGTEKLWSWSEAERSYWQPRRPSASVGHLKT